MSTHLTVEISNKRAGCNFNAKPSCVDHKHICLCQGTQIRQSYTHGRWINLSLAVMNDLSWYSDTASSILLKLTFSDLPPTNISRQPVRKTSLPQTSVCLETRLMSLQEPREKKKFFKVCSALCLCLPQP